MPPRPDPNALEPPGGWDVWLNSVEMQRRRAAQREAEERRRRERQEREEK